MANLADVTINFALQARSIGAPCPACGAAIQGLLVWNGAVDFRITLRFFHRGRICEIESSYAELTDASPEQIGELMRLDNTLRALPPYLSKFARKSLRRVSVGHVDGGGIAGVIV